MLIYFVRHGQTDWNAARRIQGHIDVPINATGQAQARRNGSLLSEIISEKERFDFIASPLMRTRQTMEIIREEMDLPTQNYRTDDRIREIFFGAWGGRTIEEAEVSDPQNYAARRADIWNVPPPGGECWRDFYKRVMNWLSSVKSDSVVVGHGGVSRCLRKYYLGLTVDEMVQLDAPQDKVMMIENGKIVWL